ncbi:MAG: hypothetical protein ABH986_04670 [archaeon]
MAKDALLKTDATQKHFSHVHATSQQAWKQAGLHKVFGNLQLGESKKVLPNISGPEFLIIYPENAQEVVSRLKPGQHASIGGFCFLHDGMLTASKRLTDKNGRRFTVHLDLRGIPPKDVFPGGKPLPASLQSKLNGARLSPNGWHLNAPGINQGVPLEVITKTLRYFEIARATGTNLKLLIPTHEYISSTIPNMKLLNIAEEREAADALKKIGENFARTFYRMQKEFFPNVKLEVILTHGPKFRSELDRFARQHPNVMKMETGAADGFIVGMTPEQKRALRKLWAKESLEYKKLFSWIFTSRQPTVFMLHGRDMEGYPLEGIQAAERIAGAKHLKRNILFLGVPGAPAIAIKDAWPHLRPGVFGRDSRRLGGRDNALPVDIDARADGYFGRRTEKAYSDRLPKHAGEGMQKGQGECPSFAYVRTIGPYVGVTEGRHPVKKSLGQCFANSSHEQCSGLFKKTHSRLKRKLHSPKKKTMRRVQHRI